MTYGGLNLENLGKLTITQVLTSIDAGFDLMLLKTGSEEAIYSLKSKAYEEKPQTKETAQDIMARAAKLGI